jgi:hypothetical protein
MDADSLPVVIPFVHTGMQDIMPVGKRIPRTGKRVNVYATTHIVEFINLCGILNYLFGFLGYCGCG